MEKFNKYDVLMEVLEIIKLDMNQKSTNVFKNQRQKIINSINFIESNSSLQQIIGNEMKIDYYGFKSTNRSVTTIKHSIDSRIIKIRETGESDLADAIRQLENAICKIPTSEISKKSKLDALQLLDELIRKYTSQDVFKSIMRALGRGLLEIIKNADSISKTLKRVWPIIERLWT